MPIVILPSGLSICRLCGVSLPHGTVCPDCKLVAESTDDVRLIDILLSVLMGIVALSVTLPATWARVFRMIVGTYTASELLTAAFAISLWNAYILGIPVALVAMQWKQRVQSGVNRYAAVWHDYWLFQLISLLPVWLLVVAAFPVLVGTVLPYIIDSFIRYT